MEVSVNFEANDEAVDMACMVVVWNAKFTGIPDDYLSFELTMVTALTLLEETILQ